MNKDNRNALLSDIYNFQYGMGNTINNIGGDYPIYGSNGVVGFTNLYNSEDAPVIGHIGAYAGIVNWAPGKHFVTYNGVICRIKHGINSRFGYYLLLHSNLQKRLRGSTQPFVSYDLLNDVKVFVPNYEIQNKIASVLTALDSKIDLNNRINAELEAMAKTIYDYWFIQFDFPDENGKPYKSSGGKMVWNEELKREIPEEWKDGTLSNIAELVRGVTYDVNDIKDENEQDVIPILRATNISGNVIDLNNMVFVPIKNVSKNQLLNKYDILITMSSGSKEHIGKNGFFYFNSEAAFGAFCAKIVAKTNFRFYLYSYTQSDFMFSTIKNECLGTNINNLNGSLVKGFKMVIPPNKYIDLFNDKVCSIYEKIGNNLIENQQLSELRDWLLPMLMNGQVRVN